MPDASMEKQRLLERPAGTEGESKEVRTQTEDRGEFRSRRAPVLQAISYRGADEN
jgi:hypothetical protein